MCFSFRMKNCPVYVKKLMSKLKYKKRVAFFAALLLCLQGYLLSLLGEHKRPSEGMEY